MLLDLQLRLLRRANNNAATSKKKVEGRYPQESAYSIFDHRRLLFRLSRSRTATLCLSVAQLSLARFLVPTLVLASTNPLRHPKKPHDITEAGQTRNDNFFWLREKDNPEVLKYLEAENRYTESALKHIGKLQETLYNEMRGRIKESDVSVPEKTG